MVKSKQMKVLRKQLASVMKCPYDVKDHVHLPSAAAAANNTTMRDVVAVTDVPTGKTLEWCQQLFERNMAEMYRQSSWGLDMEKKKEEWTHKTSRFILLVLSTDKEGKENADVVSTTAAPKSQPPQPPPQQQQQLVAFINYRFVIEDDALVLYVYELQVQTPRQGYGQCLMDAMTSIGQHVGGGVERIMLTVFRTNTTALAFYEQLSFRVDGTSPDNEDYVILFKVIHHDNDGGNHNNNSNNNTKKVTALPP